MIIEGLIDELIIVEKNNYYNFKYYNITYYLHGSILTFNLNLY